MGLFLIPITLMLIIPYSILFFPPDFHSSKKKKPIKLCRHKYSFDPFFRDASIKMKESFVHHIYIGVQSLKDRPPLFVLLKFF